MLDVGGVDGSGDECLSDYFGSEAISKWMDGMG